MAGLTIPTAHQKKILLFFNAQDQKILHTLRIAVTLISRVQVHVVKENPK